MSKTSPEETPKKQIAKRVITPKRKYFVPGHAGEIEAKDLSDVEAVVTKQLKKQEDGDANN